MSDVGDVVAAIVMFVAVGLMVTGLYWRWWR